VVPLVVGRAYEKKGDLDAVRAFCVSVRGGGWWAFGGERFSATRLRPVGVATRVYECVISLAPPTPGRTIENSRLSPTVKSVIRTDVGNEEHPLDYVGLMVILANGIFRVHGDLRRLPSDMLLEPCSAPCA